MKVYSIFDDYGEEPISKLQSAGIEITVHPLGVPRPDSVQMKEIFEQYDGVIIGTSQKMPEEMFENIDSHKIIATASVGLDHIKVPESKRHLITVLNTPKANAQSVAEYTVGCALACCKRLAEGAELYKAGKNNKALHQKPEDLYGKTLGVVGAGNISKRIMEYGNFLGMQVLCWTQHPEKHESLKAQGVEFVTLDELLKMADVISVNLPNCVGTRDLISEEKVQMLQNNVIFISVSRKDTVNYQALFRRAQENPGFYVCLDLDVTPEIAERIPDLPNVLVTPHIAGGTVATRKRMFLEVAEQLVRHCGV